MSTALSTSNVDESVQKRIEIEDSNFINSVVFLADGKHIVGGGLEGNIRCWRAIDGQEVGKPINMPGDSILSLAASRDGKWIVSGMESGQVMVWNAEDHSKVNQFTAHAHFPVEVVDVSPDGTRIATGSHDSAACVWSLSTGERLLGPLQHDNTLASVKYSLDGQLLATATCDVQSIRIYDSQDGRLLINMPFKVDSYDQSLAWSDDSEHLFALSDGNVKWLDVSTGSMLSKWPIHSSNDPRGITLARNGKFIAACANTAVSFWDTTTEKQIGPVIEHADVLLCMAISPNYDLVTSGARSTIVRSLRDVVPICYCDDSTLIPCKRKISLIEEENLDHEESVKSLLTDVRSLRAQNESSHKKIARLEDTVQELRTELADSQRKADQVINNLNTTVESLHSDLRARDENSNMKITHLEAIVQELRVRLGDSHHTAERVKK